MFVGRFLMFSGLKRKSRIYDPVIPVKAGIHTFREMFYLQNADVPKNMIAKKLQKTKMPRK